MAEINKALQKLISNSIKITEKTVIVYPQFGEKSYANCSDICSQYNKKYCIDRGIIAFVYGNQLYVTAFNSKIFHLIRANKLKPSSFWVPFANGEYPLEEEKRWNSIINCK